MADMVKKVQNYVEGPMATFRPVYYDGTAPATSALAQWKGTFLSRTLVKQEFWVFVLLHLAAVTAARLELIPGLDAEEIGPGLWESAATVQFFMTFFLTFYNEHCYRRYQHLYRECMDVLDGSLLFVFELTVSLNYEDLMNHRLAATKYCLAAIYIFFMTTTGGAMSPKEWKEMIHKGLLTPVEAEMLRDYQGEETATVLLLWAMLVVDTALTEDCVWTDDGRETKHDPGIVHMHNRIDRHIHEVMTSMHAVHRRMGLPIPFTYFHLMSCVLLLNFILAGFILALFGNFMTVLPFSMVCMLFMGLREVACQLADPFGQDDVDFPVEMFINYVFEHSFCLLEAFNYYEMETLQRSINDFRGFTEDQLTQIQDREKLYQQTGVTLNKSFHWQKIHNPISTLEPEEDSVGALRKSLNPKFQEGEMLERAKSRFNGLKRKADHEERKLKALQNEITLLEAESTRRLQQKAAEERRWIWSQVQAPSTTAVNHPHIIKTHQAIAVQEEEPEPAAIFSGDKEKPKSDAHRDFLDARSRVGDIRRYLHGAGPDEFFEEDEQIEDKKANIQATMSSRETFESAARRFRGVKDMQHRQHNHQHISHGGVIEDAAPGFHPPRRAK